MRALVAYPVIARILGGVVIAAGALKGYQLVTDPGSPASQGLPASLAVVEIEVEFFLGLWLASGWRPGQSRKAALLLFAVFAAVALGKAVLGEATCGCFGRLEVRPGQILVFDLVALALLWASKPVEARPRAAGRDEGLAPGRRGPRWAWAVTLLLGAFALATGVAVRAYLAGPAEGALEVRAPEFDFGKVAPGRRLTHRFELTNSGKEPIRLVSMRSSCACITAEDLTGRTIPPGQGITLPVTLATGEKEGRRSGTVRISYRGPAETGTPAWRSVRLGCDVVTD
jgi:hypothetical protein